MEAEQLKRVLEAALLAATSPLTPAQLGGLFSEEEAITHEDISRALEQLALDCESRGIELKEVASGFRFQIREDVHAWVARLWSERPSKYSRALLETLALIAYRQPITRAEIEQIRGVAVSSHMVKTLEEREWIRVVGYRDVPGKPALFGTTRNFLDYFNLRSLDELPALAEIRDLEEFEPQLDLNPVAVRRTLELPPEDEEPVEIAVAAEAMAADNESPTADVASDASAAPSAVESDLANVDEAFVDPDDLEIDDSSATEMWDDDVPIEASNDDSPETDPPDHTEQLEQEQQVDLSINDTAPEPHDDAAAPIESDIPTTSDDVPEHTA
ncbi:MAG: SMC-Scp complex subunit ScpB [Tahibacter sp.]